VTHKILKLFYAVQIFQTNFLTTSLFSCVSAPFGRTDRYTNGEQLAVTCRQLKVPCCRSVTVHPHSFLISAAYSKPSSFTVSEFFLETLIHARLPSSVSSVVHLVLKPLILPVFVKNGSRNTAHCIVGRRRSNLLPFFVPLWLPSLFLLFLFLFLFYLFLFL
jgi:hypothetical protein